MLDYILVRKVESKGVERLYFETKLPEDPIILLSFVNTKLRDEFTSLENLCGYYNVKPDSLIGKLSQMNYHYNRSTNQFV